MNTKRMGFSLLELIASLAMVSAVLFVILNVQSLLINLNQKNRMDSVASLIAANVESKFLTDIHFPSDEFFTSSNGVTNLFFNRDGQNHDASGSAYKAELHALATNSDAMNYKSKKRDGMSASIFNSQQTNPVITLMLQRSRQTPHP